MFVYTRKGILFCHKNNDVLIYATMCMNLENISQIRNEEYCMIPLM